VGGSSSRSCSAWLGLDWACGCSAHESTRARRAGRPTTKVEDWAPPRVFASERLTESFCRADCSIGSNGQPSAHPCWSTSGYRGPPAWVCTLARRAGGRSLARRWRLGAGRHRVLFPRSERLSRRERRGPKLVRLLDQQGFQRLHLFVPYLFAAGREADPDSVPRGERRGERQELHPPDPGPVRRQVRRRTGRVYLRSRQGHRDGTWRLVVGSL
jgi:hypothetical protein